jgi:hypothetical protein
MSTTVMGQQRSVRPSLGDTEEPTVATANPPKSSEAVARARVAKPILPEGSTRAGVGVAEPKPPNHDDNAEVGAVAQTAPLATLKPPNPPLAAGLEAVAPSPPLAAGLEAVAPSPPLPAGLEAVAPSPPLPAGLEAVAPTNLFSISVITSKLSTPEVR